MCVFIAVAKQQPGVAPNEGPTHLSCPLKNNTYTSTSTFRTTNADSQTVTHTCDNIHNLLICALSHSEITAIIWSLKTSVHE